MSPRTAIASLQSIFALKPPFTHWSGARFPITPLRMRCRPTRAAVIAPTPTITGVAIDKMKEKGDDEERIQGVAVLNATRLFRQVTINTHTSDPQLTQSMSSSNPGSLFLRSPLSPFRSLAVQDMFPFCASRRSYPAINSWPVNHVHILPIIALLPCAFSPHLFLS